MSISSSTAMASGQSIRNLKNLSSSAGHCTDTVIKIRDETDFEEKFDWCRLSVSS